MRGPVLFNSFINDLNDEAECTCYNFIGDIELGGVADEPDWCGAIQRDFNGLEKWVDKNLIKFDKGKGKVTGMEQLQASVQTAGQLPRKRLGREGPRDHGGP